VPQWKAVNQYSLNSPAWDNLFQCWLKAKRNKSKSPRVQRFGEDPLRYLMMIQERLRSRTYSFGPYKSFTVQEKKFRHVVEAPMKDRVVHWMLYEYLLPIWQPRFIHDTFGNLPDRGTHAAVFRLAQFARARDSQWALQLDVSKYFYSVNHDILKSRVLRYIGDHDVRQLLIALIDSFQTDSQFDDLFAPSTMYRRTAAKGMPIGNLSSQLFANIYLSDFDHWMKETLRIKQYIRYVDDMVILAEMPDELREIRTMVVGKPGARWADNSPEENQVGTGEGWAAVPRACRLVESHIDGPLHAHQVHTALASA